MAYSYQNEEGKTYFLHSTTSTTKTGKERTLYYFAKEVKAEGSLDAVPAGYEVSETKTGLPVLKKKK
ncbi:MAG: hypothetical protein MAG431_00800 [Chloroflexi bacterium]|nr:hypothetical protein [Chloroflexota bacterium]